MRATDEAVPEIVGMTATEMAARIASRDLSAVEVVEAHIRRIEATHTRINALVERRFDDARADAKAADAAQARGDPLGPLHGVPVTVKEMFDVAGMPTTSALVHLRNNIAHEDAALVGRLRRAGAIVLGKTNVPQLALMFETDNPLYGRTNNPWDTGRSPGGSSGGEAAIIAAGGSPLGLGTDAGGSIRNPAHCCGICGLKPTAGRLSMAGLATLPNWPRDWCQPGPMARCVDDLAAAMQVLIPLEGDGGELGDPPLPLGDPSAISIEGLRIAAYDDDGYFPAAPAMRRAVSEAVTALRKLGARVEPFTPPDLPSALRTYFAMLSADGFVHARRMANGSPRDWRLRRMFLAAAIPASMRSPVAWLIDKWGHRYEAGFLRAVRKRALSVDEFWRHSEKQEEYRRQFAAALDKGRFDAIICPPFALPASKHGSLHAPFAASYGVLYNLLGMPAGVVTATRVRPDEETDRPEQRDPVVREACENERGSQGLPVAVQVVARHWREDVSLAVMAALERHFRGEPDYPASPPE